MELIVAVDENWGIGRGTDMLVAIKEDLKRFRSLTLGKTVVYGRKTMASFPGGKALPKRENIVLSRHLEAGEGFQVCRNYRELYELIQDRDDVVIIGGASVYKDLLDYCAVAEVTKHLHAFEDAEHFMVDLDEKENWIVTDTSSPLFDEASGLSFQYVRYENMTVKDLALLKEQD